MAAADYNSDDYFWWLAEDKKLYEKVFGYIKVTNQNQSYRRAANLRYLRQYGNQDPLELQTYNYFRSETSAATLNKVTFNVTQSMIDTVVSKITKNKPKPTFLTEAGDWSQQQKAKRLTQFVAGQFYATDFYKKSAQAFKDSLVWGTGAIKVFNRDGQMRAERVFIEELTVDDNESLYGEPRQIHQSKFIHKDVLKQLFPEKKSIIEAATQHSEGKSDIPFSKNPHMLYVVESWHLKSSENAKDGKHAITICNDTLLSEPWEKDYFPFIFHRWNERSIGFFGQGLAEQLEGIQSEINKLLRTIQVSMHLVSIPKIFLEASSKVVSAHLDNKIGGIIRYSGSKPDNGPLASIPPELFSHLDRLYNRAFEIAGVSQLSAQSSKPSGLDSGKALREFNDIETERFMEVGQRYEQSFIDAAEIFINEMKEIVETSEQDLEVLVKDKNFVERIKWSEVNMDEDKYVMHIFPTSSLSSTPAGRLQEVQELLQAGFISQEEGRDLLDFPDLQAHYNLANAAVEDIKFTVDSIVSKGKYLTPEPYQNLEYGIEKMQQAYLFYRTQGLPEKRLELMRRWMEDANALLIKAATPPPPDEEAPDQLIPGGLSANATQDLEAAAAGGGELLPSGAVPGSEALVPETPAVPVPTGVLPS